MNTYRITPSGGQYQFTEILSNGDEIVVVIYPTRKAARDHLFDRLTTTSDAEIDEHIHELKRITHR
jgi:predicted phosphoribosyltransferase